LARGFAKNLEKVKAAAAEIKKRGITHVVTLARGSSQNAAVCFKSFFEKIAGIPVCHYNPSLTTVYGASLNFENAILVAVSQSGMSSDTMEVAKSAKSKGALVVSLTNNDESKLAAVSDFHFNLCCGEEKSVAATKTFSSSILILYMLAACLAGKTETLVELEKIPQKMSAALSLADDIDDVSKTVKNAKNIFVLTRGLMKGIAEEASLKLKECCYKFTISYSVSEFIHGPLALIDENATVLLLAPGGELTRDFNDIATRLSLLGANIIAFSDIKDVQATAAASVKMPQVSQLEATFSYLAAAQIFVEKLAVRLNINPDQPRNLKKVTITR
jgi:glucosamine--fructose-6-phosphate aminotransferase (isomerizing)